MQPPIDSRSLYREAYTAEATIEPFRHEELRAALRHPSAAVDVLLADRRRWTASVIGNRDAGDMVILLLMWTVLFSLPYGLVLSWNEAWKIGTLFLGSVALCLPSLHVVARYLGLRVHVAQSFAFATIIATVASIFSCSFAPILWFLQVTTHGASSQSTVAGLSGTLLGLAALAGAIHGMRCLQLAEQPHGGSGFTVVVLVWQVLLLFIGLRMSDALGLS